MLTLFFKGLFQAPIRTNLGLGVSNSPNTKLCMGLPRGFSLIELLMVVAIIAILAAVGVPMYSGYVDSAKISVAQNGLRSIYLMELDYYSENNNAYYTTGASCSDKTSDINTNLFGNNKTLDSTNFYYCIKPRATDGYEAVAQEISGDRRIYSIDDTNTTNF